MLHAHPRTEFGRLLQEYRLRAGLTQEALAERAGLGRRSIQGLERGENRPLRETVQRLARVLGLSPAEQARFAEAVPPAPRRRRAASALHVLDLPADPRERLPRHNLPVPVTSFVGRERERVEVKRLLAGARLLTLTGTGGCGKTRLALQVAADLVDAYPDGVWLVELASLADPELVPAAVAAALGVREGPQQTILTTLLSYLRARHLLLLLDNCEHLVVACASIASALLRGCPAVRILATSREALRLDGEVIWRVRSLTSPAMDRPIHLTELAASEAGELFLSRAHAAQPDFVVGDRDAPVIAQICRRLDGIPLAIELAAARVGLLGVEPMAQRLDDRFRLLTLGMREALPRHQTLRALVDWSYDLLSASERTLFRRLGAFAGTFDLEAVEAVCTSGELDCSVVLEALGGLVGKSLVLREEGDGAPRFRLLETIRQYAGERLVEAGETALVRRRHADWYLGLAERAHVEVWGAAETAWLARLGADIPNLREALGWFRDNDATAGLRLAVGLYRFWYNRGLVAEGVRWLEDLLKRMPDRTLLRAEALFGMGWLAFWQGDGPAVKSALGESIPIFQENHDDRGTGRSLLFLGRVAFQEGDHGKAEALYRSGLGSLRGAGDRPGIAQVQFFLGYLLLARGETEEAAALLAESRAIFRELRALGDRDFFALHQLAEIARLQGDPAEARALAIASLAAQREMGHRHLVVHALDRLAALARAEGDYGQARALLAEGLELAREVGAQPWIGRVLISLAKLSQAEADYPQARAVFRQSLGIARAIGDRGAMANCIGGLGLVATQQGAWLEGVRLIGAARQLDELYPSPFDPTERAQFRECLDLARSALGGEAFSRAWAAGQAMALACAVEGDRD